MSNDRTLNNWKFFVAFAMKLKNARVGFAMSALPSDIM
jgi:hypothetical protein